MITSALYDRLGRTYSTTRRTDPRLASAIRRALGSARTVLNVGAGAGSYEPPDCDVVAVEPSVVMIGQRPAAAAPAVQARAEQLPFDDDSFDAAMAILSDHHWTDRRRGLGELRRVARDRVVLFNANPAEAELFWLTREFLRGFLELIPDRYREPGAWEQELRQTLGTVALAAFPIPHDCADGFYGAFWRRPGAYLDADTRAGISVFAQLPAGEVAAAIEALRADLESGEWHEKHRHLLGLSEHHLGYHMAIADLRS